MHRAPHQVVRYARALRAVRQLGAASVLEIGSGDEGIGTWCAGPFVALDRSFSERRLKIMRPVVGDIASLPFRENAFDLVLSIDVLQDLPRDLLARSCSEMARVSAGAVLVTAVCGEEGDASDRANAAWCRRKGYDVPPWLDQEIETGVHAVESILEALQHHGRVTHGRNMSARWNERFFRVEQRLKRYRAMTALQPFLRLWARTAPFELPGTGPAYRWWFRLEIQPTVSPPRASS